MHKFCDLKYFITRGLYLHGHKLKTSDCENVQEN